MKNPKTIFPVFLFLLSSIFNYSCQTNPSSFASSKPEEPPVVENPKIAEITSEPVKKLLESAVEQTKITKSYDPAYVVLDYPNGDVPVETGVCTDVVVRAFRRAGVDLQKEVHEDMQQNFPVYPQKWGLPAADSNIDHRRVPNLQTFFTRRGKALSVTDKPRDYQPGDVVSWDLDGKGMTHIGMVSNFWNARTKRFSIIHNIGGGVLIEDALFNWKITGHYRYF